MINNQNVIRGTMSCTVMSLRLLSVFPLITLAKHFASPSIYKPISVRILISTISSPVPAAGPCIPLFLCGIGDKWYEVDPSTPFYSTRRVRLPAAR
jgi:hypothetical protein